MKSRPIPFSAPMVRALLNGSKTQTRRVVKPDMNLEQRQSTGFSYTDKKGMRWMCGVGSSDAETMRNFTRQHCPYGQPGDQLWVREAWRARREFDSVKPSDLEGPVDGILGTPIIYEASRHESVQFGKLRRSMFMPRWASRITLEITGVRVERLQDISEADAIAEGIKTNAAWPGGFFKNYLLNSEQDVRALPPVRSYQSLWESINGPGSWGANPWVWVVEFKRLET
jgi:hypothetical protein